MLGTYILWSANLFWWPRLARDKFCGANAHADFLLLFAAFVINNGIFAVLLACAAMALRAL